MSDDFTNSFGISVAALIQKFADQEALQAALDEAREARELAEKAIRSKNELELDISLKGGKFSGNYTRKSMHSL